MRSARLQLKDLRLTWGGKTHRTYSLYVRENGRKRKIQTLGKLSRVEVKLWKLLLQYLKSGVCLKLAAERCPCSACADTDKIPETLREQIEYTFKKPPKPRSAK